MESDILTVLWTEPQIHTRISQLAHQLTSDLSTTAQPPVFVGVATGAALFLADLVRRLEFPVYIDFIRVGSYGFGSTISNGKPEVTCDLKLDVKGKHVVLVEDIVDTGNTIAHLLSHLESKGASSVSVCTFLDKPSRRKTTFEMVGKGKFYRGFECPDYFIVGYGMDFAELYRNLPYVGVLKPECYKQTGEDEPRN